MEHQPAYHVHHTAAVHGKTGVTAAPSELPPHSGRSMARDRVTGGASSSSQGASPTAAPGRHEDFRMSEEWDDEMETPDVGTMEEDHVGSKTDERGKAERRKIQQEKVEQERQELEDELQEVETKIRETQAALADARDSGDHEAARELGQHLDQLKGSRDRLQQTLQELFPSPGTSPVPAARGSAPASGEPAPAQTSPVSTGSPGGGSAPSAGYPSSGAYAPSPTSYPSTGTSSSGGGYVPSPASGGAVSGVSPGEGTRSSGGGRAARPVAADPSVGAAPATPRAPGEGLIRPGMKVLQIGDSHTIGPFGTELDKKLRSTGAKVETYGSSGSSPSYWLNGTTTHSGYVARHANGSVDQPPWNQAHATPRLSDLVARERPDVVVVNLGANMRGMSEKQIKEEVGRLATVARSTGAKLVWVGPPRTRDDMSNPASIKSFDAAMSKAVAPYGTYLDSAQYTSYSGGDGIHYSGTEGTRTARNWADRIFSDLQSAP